MTKILAIETSCDETACAILDDKLNILSSVVTSQIDVHARFGGVIPEVASRMHVEQISIIVDSAIKQANISKDELDAIAYTYGPGLVGSLHIGSICAKSIAYYLNKPLIGVHHLKGHVFINELVKPIKYPCICLIVSGGHSEIVYIEDDENFKIIGSTLDDAIGETYDKVARILNLEYPGGPKIDKLAKLGRHQYDLPKPKVDGYNFSYSGLKNATIQLVNKLNRLEEKINVENLCYDFQEKALSLLIEKLKLVLKDYRVEQIMIAGGVACNSRLRELMEIEFNGYDLILPPLNYTTDNATMIAVAAFHYFKHNKFVGYDKESKPNLSIEEG